MQRTYSKVASGLGYAATSGGRWFRDKLVGVVGGGAVMRGDGRMQGRDSQRAARSTTEVRLGGTLHYLYTYH